MDYVMTNRYFVIQKISWYVLGIHGLIVTSPCISLFLSVSFYLSLSLSLSLPPSPSLFPNDSVLLPPMLILDNNMILFRIWTFIYIRTRKLKVHYKITKSEYFKQMANKISFHLICSTTMLHSLIAQDTVCSQASHQGLNTNSTSGPPRSFLFACSD